MPKETKVRHAVAQKPAARRNVGRGHGVRINGRGGAVARRNPSVGDEDMLLLDPAAPSAEARALEARGFKRVNVPARHL